MSLFYDPSYDTCREHTTQMASGIICQSMHPSSPCGKLRVEDEVEYGDALSDDAPDVPDFGFY
jgi:hypothetical protein